MLSCVHRCFVSTLCPDLTVKLVIECRLLWQLERWLMVAPNRSSIRCQHRCRPEKIFIRSEHSTERGVLTFFVGIIGTDGRESRMSIPLSWHGVLVSNFSFASTTSPSAPSFSSTAFFSSSTAGSLIDGSSSSPPSSDLLHSHFFSLFQF